jgi:hypothetical protein
MIEQISKNHVLVKKEGQTLHLFDIQSKIMVQVGKIDMFKRRYGYYFLHKRKLLLTFTNQEVYVWNYHGELVSSYKDIYWNNHCIPCIEYFYMSYGNNIDSQGYISSTIYVNNIVTGECLSKIDVKW